MLPVILEAVDQAALKAEQHGNDIRLKETGEAESLSGSQMDGGGGLFNLLTRCGNTVIREA